MNPHILTKQLQQIEPIETQGLPFIIPSLLTPPRDFCGKLQIYHFTTDISSQHFKSFKIFFNSSVFNFISVHLLKVCLNKDPHALHSPQFSFKILSSIWFPFHLSSYHSFFDEDTYLWSHKFPQAASLKYSFPGPMSLALPSSILSLTFRYRFFRGGWCGNTYFNRDTQ